MSTSGEARTSHPSSRQNVPRVMETDVKSEAMYLRFNRRQMSLILINVEKLFNVNIMKQGLDSSIGCLPYRISLLTGLKFLAMRTSATLDQKVTGSNPITGLGNCIAATMTINLMYDSNLFK